MRNTDSDRILTLGALTRAAAADPAALIAAEEARYTAEIRRTAAALKARMHGRTVVMLSGPSSAGKTTTSHLLKDTLARDGVDVKIVSLDDFYRGKGKAPLLPDGSYDYESVHALDLGRLQACLGELLTGGCSELPVFDFSAQQPASHTRRLYLTEHSLVIFEGIHALNPLIEEHLPGERLLKVFVNTLSPVFDDTGKLLARRDIRLIRRLLRDIRFRGSSLENTLAMWRQVVRGEQLYLFPYVDTVDFLLDTTHAYEPFLFAGELLPLLNAAPESPFKPQLEELAAKLAVFPPLPLSLLPKESLMREFLGQEA